ncbi:RES family NAD+ phosphorylase [Zooshikella marina]|uniref:RES family NAD+ phosphorylase n=1 Tax=Zooshikella ganghwensis TaxID=202772 RepID=UPI001BAF8B4D|nr:RES family NAD+ phosphorylase [Zooshikella ganghwensis]MBU2708858.1 RES family NAD+ phosphorylase [Zooshikella ganghwensis]
MEVFRLAHRNYADLSGKGGMFHSGRWHSRGQLIVYTASSRALSLLERLVHENAAQIPPLTLLTIWVPDDAPIQHTTAKELPEGWDALPDGSVARRIGDQWLQQQKTAFLKVPSSIVQDEFNLLLNPVHPDFLKVKIVDQRDFSYDKRLGKLLVPL